MVIVHRDCYADAEREKNNSSALLKSSALHTRPQIHPVYTEKKRRLLTKDNRPQNNTGEPSAFNSLHHHSVPVN